MRHATLLRALVTVSVTSACAPSAPAAITAFWRPVTITPAAIANDPVLANMQTFDLMVTTDGNWASAGMRAVLPGSNRFYKNALGGNTRPGPAFLPLFPALEFTTYVTAPGDTGAAGAPSVLGGFPEGSPTSLGDAGAPIPGTFSMSWGDLVVDAPGTYEIARLTFPQGILPNVININDTGPTGNYSNTSQVTPDSTTEIPDIPEPGALALVSMAALAIARRRRERVR